MYEFGPNKMKCAVFFQINNKKFFFKIDMFRFAYLKFTHVLL